MSRSGAGRLHGYLVIDKPAGWTSHDVVGRVRRMTGERKVGHAGTLDPAATGVLPVAIGSATRSLEFLAESSKTYLAELTFGMTTDSYDGDGMVTSISSFSDLDAEKVTNAVKRIEGPISQIPPMHSAIKIGGKRLYELARKGEEIEREPRGVFIHQIELVSWNAPVATICIDCSKGTYVRSIAHDLGEYLGCGAYLSNLVRVRSGPFVIADAWTIRELEELDLVGMWESTAVHPDGGAHTLDAIVLSVQQVVDWGHGKTIAAVGEPSGWVRVYDEAGSWLGIAHGEAESGCWQPHKVVNDAA
jgi:tRNA pseudouridine55 synthase